MTESLKLLQKASGQKSMARRKQQDRYCGWSRNPLRADITLFWEILILGFLRWCRISSIHSIPLSLDSWGLLFETQKLLAIGRTHDQCSTQTPEHAGNGASLSWKGHLEENQPTLGVCIPMFDPSVIMSKGKSQEYQSKWHTNLTRMVSFFKAHPKDFNEGGTPKPIFWVSKPNDFWTQTQVLPETGPAPPCASPRRRSRLRCRGSRDQR